jgi:hypothetical protein
MKQSMNFQEPGALPGAAEPPLRNPAAKRRIKCRKKPEMLSIKMFFGKYYAAMLQGEARDLNTRLTGKFLASTESGDYPVFLTRGEKLRAELWDWWPIRLLRTAAAENDVEGYKRILHFILLDLGVRVPAGVLVPFRWKVGRPPETERVYAAWVERGKPALDFRALDALAKHLYADEFTRALSDGTLRKKLRDRIRNTIRRHQPGVPATKSRSNS